MYLIKNDSKRCCDDIEYTCNRCNKIIKIDSFSYSCETDNVDICIPCRNELISRFR